MYILHAYLVCMKLCLDVCKNLIALDAGESFCCFEDVSIQLQNLLLTRHRGKESTSQQTCLVSSTRFLGFDVALT